MLGEGAVSQESRLGIRVRVEERVRRSIQVLWFDLPSASYSTE
jgi:hypothetical protein